MQSRREEYFRDVDWREDFTPIIADDGGKKKIEIDPEIFGAIETKIRAYEEVMRYVPVSAGLEEYAESCGFNSIEDLKDFFAQYFEAVGRKLSLFDFGCGIGRAMDHFSDLPMFDSDQMVGITLRLDHIRDRTRERIIEVNACDIAPARTDVEVKRFDVVVSMNGVATYSPFDILSNDCVFGVLQALNYLNVGGILMLDMETQRKAGTVIKKLISMKILKRIEFNGAVTFQLLKRFTPKDLDRISDLIEADFIHVKKR